MTIGYSYKGACMHAHAQPIVGIFKVQNFDIPLTSYRFFVFCIFCFFVFFKARRGLKKL